MIEELRVGPQVTADGAVITARASRTGEASVSDAHGRYQEAAVRGNVFTAANAAATSSAGLAATYTGGVCISNPAGNTKNLVILKVSGALVVISAAVTGFGLLTGYVSTGLTVHTTPLTPFSTLIGTGPAATAKADQAATLVGTPAWLMQVAVTQIAAGTFGASIDLEGSVVIPPGAYIATATTIASPASGFQGSISWEEVAI